MHLQAVIFTESFLTVRALIGTLTYKIKAGFLSEKSAAAKQARAPTPPAPGLRKHLGTGKKRLRHSQGALHLRAEEELPLLRRGSEPGALPALRYQPHLPAAGSLPLLSHFSQV